MPENTVNVTRPGRWGNPWKEGSTGWTVLPGGLINREPHEPLTVEQAIESFRNSTEYQLTHDPEFLADLRGKNLACFCRLDAPCHADVLLELANR
ncbi:DUF4326 domain-containing protein [Pseudarthrobacter sp. NIBRBAC000502771]|uniref:DUF4326 domain-containing protein n=1 Tax=Pseudarthrobacter sp. NIBRBAC000502771 TaxID=2590774 RepID=UPI001FED3E8D|nr:DUF4326 domain-containing protein [Pseudarthrobacter sp. NIBRBAC000502771]